MCSFSIPSIPLLLLFLRFLTAFRTSASENGWLISSFIDSSKPSAVQLSVLCSNFPSTFSLFNVSKKFYRSSNGADCFSVFPTDIIFQKSFGRGCFKFLNFCILVFLYLLRLLAILFLYSLLTCFNAFL